MDRIRRFEIGASVVIIVACAILIYESLGLPPGSFEPLGSAPVPQATAGIIIFLSLIVIVNALRAPPAKAETPAGEEEPADDPVSALLLAAATLLYVLLLHLRVIDFGTLTALYLFGLIAALERFRPRALIGAAILGLLVGYGVQYLFTQVFVVDLPAT